MNDKVKSFIMLGNTPFGDNSIIQDNQIIDFILNIKIEYETGHIVLLFNKQNHHYDYVQGSKPSTIKLDLAGLNYLIEILKIYNNGTFNLGYTCGSNGVKDRIISRLNISGQIITITIQNKPFIIKEQLPIGLFISQLKLAMDMLKQGVIEYSVKKDHVAGKMQSGSNTPAQSVPVGAGKTPPAMPGVQGISNNMNTAPEGVTLSRPENGTTLGPELNKAPGNPGEMLPPIPNRRP